MKKNTAVTAFLAAVSTFSTLALAHDDRPPRYRAFELPAVELEDPACVPGYATTQSASDMNFRRYAAGVAGCYHQQGVGSDGLPFYQRVTQPFAWSPFTGSYLLPGSPGFEAIPLGVDIYNNAYGLQTGPSFDGVKWTPGGGLSVVFGADPLCGFGISLAITANARGEIVGWAFRPVPEGFCNIHTVVRRPSGEEVVGPADGSPAGITNAGIVTGAIASQAATWNLRNGAIVRLHQATGSETSTAYDLNDRGVAVGVATVLESDGSPPICARSTPLLWDNRQRERVLPKPQGAVSGTALDITEDGVIVGYSDDSVCYDGATETQRAVIWTDGRVTDLNRQLVGRPGIRLLQATSITERGEIVAFGYRANEPEKPCPQLVQLPDFGSASDNSTCHDTHAYLLIPAD
jgi:hypothetical protein